MAIKIRKNAFLSMLAGAKAASPNEFICLLRGKREGGDLVIEDTLIPPGIMVSETMTSFSDWMLPWIEGLVGTFHSHPGGIARPSKQDGWLFSQKGGVHFIAASPFREKDMAAFLGNGKRAEFVVVE
ncbi:MAG: Mov34/MPN/PAD-1 family protein [Candidatus Micrarchaeia archaeon]